MIEWWKRELEEAPAIGLVMAVWCVMAWWNFDTGRVLAGKPLGVVFVAIAALGAYAAHKQQGARGVKFYLLWAAVVIQILLGQFAAWQSLGLSLDSGAAELSSKATGRAEAQAALERARDERKRIGTTRPADAVQADVTLECEKKSKAYPDGVGPKCTGFRAELATAKRAEKLDARIPELVAALADAPAVRSENAATAVPQSFASGLLSWTSGKPVAVSGDDVRFALEVFVAAAVEFVGTLGWWLFGSGRVRHGGSDDGTDAGGGDTRRAHGANRMHAPDAKWASEGATKMREAVDAVMGGMARALPAPPQLTAIAGPPGYHAPGAWSAPEGARSYGAPINIHFSSAGVPPNAANAGETSGPGFVPLGPAPTTLVAPSGADQHPARRERQDLPALPADAPPVDRSRIARALAPEERQAADVVLAFRAACLIDSDGAVVAAEDVHKRYEQWAGQRAVAAPVFARLLADVAGLQASDIAGAPHYVGVALRLGARLEAVA